MHLPSFRRSLLLASLAAAIACSTGTPYAEFERTTSPPAAGQGRILIYMSAGEGTWWPHLHLDGAALGKIGPGTFFSVDRPAGPHLLAVPPDPHLAAFGNQGQTMPVQVLVQPGAVAYVQVTVVPTPGMVTAVLTPEPAGDAQRDLAHLDLVPPAQP